MVRMFLAIPDQHTMKLIGKYRSCILIIKTDAMKKGILVVPYNHIKENLINTHFFNLDGCASLLYRASNIKKPRQRTN